MSRLLMLVAAASLSFAVAQTASAADLPLPSKEPMVDSAAGLYLDRFLHRW